MGLNLSNSQIARKLDLNKDDVQAMALQLRKGSVEYKPAARLEGIVECDEVYIVAGHKGQPSGVKKRRKGRRNRLKRGSWTRHTGEGETPDLRHDPTRWPSSHPDPGGRTPDHDSAPDRGYDSTGNLGTDRRVHNLQALT